MSESTSTNTTLTYGSVTIDFASLPAVSQMALARRGLSHLLGNETASGLKSWKDANPEATEEQIEAQKSAAIAARVEQLVNGTIGSGHGGGPRGTKLETLTRAYAWDEVNAIMVANKLKFDKETKTVRMGDQEFTKAQLIDRMIAKQPGKHEKLAQAEMRRLERVAREAGGGDTAEALGL